MGGHNIEDLKLVIVRDNKGVPLDTLIRDKDNNTLGRLPLMRSMVHTLLMRDIGVWDIKINTRHVEEEVVDNRVDTPPPKAPKVPPQPPRGAWTNDTAEVAFDKIIKKVLGEWKEAIGKDWLETKTYGS